jgi:negative regulator of flagellin synthesis FlgM
MLWLSKTDKGNGSNIFVGELRMSIKINNINNSDAISSIERGDVRRTGKTDAQPIEAKPTAESDKVNISSVALETGKLVERLKELPDVRQDRVEELQQQIASGNFQPSNTVIADAILADETK